jgi:hypothetical protein
VSADVLYEHGVVATFAANGSDWAQTLLGNTRLLKLLGIGAVLVVLFLLNERALHRRAAAARAQAHPPPAVPVPAAQ